MDIRDILLVLEADEADHAAMAVACRLARSKEARLHTRCVLPFAPTPAECFALGPAADRDVLDHAERKAAAAISAARAALSGALGATELGGDCQGIDEAEARYVLPAIAQCCDLSVIAHDPPQPPQAREFAQEVLLRGGSPCLLVPRSCRPAADFATVVVAWNGTAGAKRAIDASLPFLEIAKQVHIAVVDDPAGLDRHNDGEAMAERLGRRGIATVVHRLAGHESHAAGPLLALCNSCAADLLVMGAFGHPHLWEAFFGGTSRGMLARGGLPLFMTS